VERLVIGSGSGFWGDLLEPAVEMAERADVSHIGFDHLSELTMAILNRQKAKDPARGFIPDVVPWTDAILPTAHRRGIKLITNAGGANPRAAADAVAGVARKHGLGGLRIGIVGGDDILSDLDTLTGQGWRFENMDTGETGLDRIRDRLVAANVYTGADGIIEQLAADADVIVTGRVSDSALYVAPIMHAFGWDHSPTHTDHIAAAITVAHIIECAACVTGGMSNMWRISERPWEPGFPVAEVSSDGSAFITKTPGSGGVVNEWTVKEHLLYEIQDPKRYMMPDGIADFTTVEVDDHGNNRVHISGVRGQPRPATAKACLAYENGWIGEGMAFFPWPDALDKAHFAKRWLEERVAALGIAFEDMRIDLIGVNMLHGQTAPVIDHGMGEVGLRFALRAESRECAEMVRREVTHLWTMGPVGTAIGVPFRVRPVVSLWPTTVPWEAVQPWTDQIEVAR